MSVTTQLIESPAMRAVIRERDEALAALTNGIKGRVSVIIPCYNQAEYLHTALMSVLKQTVAPLEVIIIDDGSDSAIVVPDEPDDYPHIPVRVVRITNRGLASARNTGLMLARGEWVIPLDSDDWIDPTFLEATLAVAAETGADVVQVGIQEHGERTGQYKPGFDMPLSMVTDGHLIHTNRLWYCALIRARVIRELGGWNSRMSHLGGWEDWACWREMMRRGVKFAEADGFLFHYLCRPQSMSTEAERNRATLVGEMHRQQVSDGGRERGR